MTQQTFRGRDLREALAAVKSSLGEEALVVSTASVRDGLFGRAVEVVAQEPDTAATPLPRNEIALAAYRTATAPEPKGPAFDERLKPLEAEMRRLRAQLVSFVSRPGAVRGGHLGDASSDTPIVAHLISLGFSLEMARAWSARITQSKDFMVAVEKLVWDAVDLTGPVGAAGARVCMCVGPSGAGKTTTIAKWAAAAALEENKRVVVITLDTFRAGAIEQLARYTKLIGCELLTAKNAAQLMAALDAHAAADLILIDTPGRDPSTQPELVDIGKKLIARDKRTEIHLALPAMYGPRALRAVVQSYRGFSVNRICFTKIDETHDFAPLAAVIANDRLPLSYWTTGQRIPEDIELVSTAGVVSRVVPSLITALCGESIVVEERFV